MATKKTPAKRKKRGTITVQIGANLLHEIYEEGLPVSFLAAKYNLSCEAIYKFKNRTPYESASVPKFQPLDVLNRIEMDPLSRLKLLTQDAGQLMELTIAALLYRVQAELTNTKDNPGDKTATLKTDELIRIIEKAAPYVLPKKEEKKGGDKEKPKTRLFDSLSQSSLLKTS